MPKGLKDQISSSYIEAANRLTSKKARRRIVAYVESYDDIFFWRSVLSRFESDKLYFEVMLPARSNHLERGKKAALMSLVSDKVGRDMIACVDADYDYLIQGATFTSQKILDSKYVFHTYAYAIENLQCYAPSLHDVCVGVTLNDHSIFDMAEYLRQYSQAIFPLFVWSIWHYRNGSYGRFSILDFLKSIELGKFSLASAENLYIQGHHLFDKVVSPMMEKVCSALIHQRQTEIAHQSMHSTQRSNELSCYANSLSDVTTMLKKNYGYQTSTPFNRILKDIEEYLER